MAVLSNLFDTMCRIPINLEAVGHKSKQRLKFIEHYKLHVRGCNTGPSIPLTCTSMRHSPLAPYCLPWRPHRLLVDCQQCLGWECLWVVTLKGRYIG